MPTSPYYHDLVLWTGPVGQWPRHSLARYSYFWGGEGALWNNKYKLIGLRARIEDGFFGIGRERTMSQNYSLGLCLGFPSTSTVRFDHELGYGYRAEQTYFRSSSLDENFDWHQTEEKLWVDGTWWHYRLQTILPGIYSDARYRNGRTVREYGGFITATPGSRLYAKVGANRLIRKDWTRHLHGLTQSGRADSTDTFEARLGLRSQYQDLLVYLSWNDIRYYSSNFWQTRKGPGVGFEWYPRTPNWRLEGCLNYLQDKTLVHWWMGSILQPMEFKDNELEAKLMLVITPAHLLKPFQQEGVEQP
jgi:hypothetical protein